MVVFYPIITKKGGRLIDPPRSVRSGMWCRCRISPGKKMVFRNGAEVAVVNWWFVFAENPKLLRFCGKAVWRSRSIQACTKLFPQTSTERGTVIISNACRHHSNGYPTTRHISDFTGADSSPRLPNSCARLQDQAIPGRLRPWRRRNYFSFFLQKRFSFASRTYPHILYLSSFLISGTQSRYISRKGKKMTTPKQNYSLDIRYILDF